MSLKMLLWNYHMVTSFEKCDEEINIATIYGEMHSFSLTTAVHDFHVYKNVWELI